MSLFFIGVVEMLIGTVWTKAVTQTRVIASGVITLVSMMIWYYVIRQMVEDVSNWKLGLMYAIGCAVGTVLATWYYQVQEKKTATNLTRIFSASVGKTE